MTAQIGWFIAGIAIALLALQQWRVRSRLGEARRAHDELRESEARFSGILAIAADAIITIDQTQKIVHFNRGAEEIFGHAAGDVIGRQLGILLPARYRQAHDGHLDRFARAPETARRMGERREIFGLRADGREFPAEASISKLVSSDGLLFNVVLRDITERKRSEEADRFLAAATGELGQSLVEDATLRAIVELPVSHLADAAMLDVVAQGEAFRRIVSRRQRSEISPGVELLGALVLTEDSPSRVIDVARRGRREMVNEIDDEWLEANTEPAAADALRAIGAKALLFLPLRVAGETLGVLTLIRTHSAFGPDVVALAERYATNAAAALENTQLYHQAKLANRARDEVLSIVSHDLRNPISAISMCAQVLQETPPEQQADREELLSNIRESTAWVNRLIDDLRDVVNIERGKLSLVVAAQDPTELVEQTLHMFVLEAKEAGITIETRTNGTLPLVIADEARIVQVLGNLLRNAIKFTPAGGTVTLAASTHGGEVTLSIADRGPGLRPEHAQRVFDRYWQAPDGRSATGVGLGLSIAKGIVDAHGGRIWVESVPGQGATFSFTLRRAPDEGA